MLKIEAKSIVVRIDNKGPPNARYLPSGAIKALKVKHEKMTQVYIRADITIEGSIDQTDSIKGPVDSPTFNIGRKLKYVHKIKLCQLNVLPVQRASPFKYKKRIPSSFP
jgi:hypothetical protein